jgi:hypothetical protein
LGLGLGYSDHRAKIPHFRCGRAGLCFGFAAFADVVCVMFGPVHACVTIVGRFCDFIAAVAGLWGEPSPSQDEVMPFLLVYRMTNALPI